MNSTSQYIESFRLSVRTVLKKCSKCIGESMKS